MSEAAAHEPQASPRSWREVFEAIADDQREEGVEPLSEVEAADLADELVAEVRRERQEREQGRA